MVAAMAQPTPAPARVVLTGQDLNLSVASVDRRDFSQEFLVTVVFPILLAIILSIVLSIFFFCSRQSAEAREEMTSETQMMQFNTIRRATTNLRLMSQRRDGPPPLSPSPRPADRVPRSSPRLQPPPPYRLPPSYPASNSVTPRLGKNLAPSRFEDETVANENLQLVGRGSPRHVGNDNMGHRPNDVLSENEGHRGAPSSK